MKIAAISDLHQPSAYSIKIPECDVLIMAGDFEIKDSIYYLQFSMWLHSLDQVKYKLIVPGNHDWYFQDKNSKELSEKKYNIHYLIDSKVKIDGVTFYGTPYTPTFMNWAFMESEEQLEKRYAKIHKDTDVLITHGPPRGILDDVRDRYKKQERRNCGSEALAEWFQKRYKENKPGIINIFGHIHREESDAKFKRIIKDTFYNVSLMNNDYDIVNPVTIIEV